MARWLRSRRRAAHVFGLTEPDDPALAALAVLEVAAHRREVRWGLQRDVALGVAQARRGETRDIAEVLAEIRARRREVHAAKRAEEAIGSKERARHWLGTPNRALDGQRPRDLLASDTGARIVEDVLGRIEHGVVS